MDLQGYVGQWHRFVFVDGGSMDGFLVKSGDDYWIRPIAGEPGVLVREQDVVAVEAGEDRPRIGGAVVESGKRIESEADLGEFMGQMVRAHMKDGNTRAGRLDHALILGNRVALFGPPAGPGQSEQATTIEWRDIDRIETQ